MRRAEWPRREHWMARVGETGDAVDRARDDRLVRIECRKKRRDRASEERLACPRRSDEEQTVSSGSRDLESALGRLVSRDVF